MQPDVKRSSAAAKPGAGLPILALGFRPFFLLGGGLGALWILAWLFILAGAAPAPLTQPILWHAHEMIYGYAVAVVAGFLLTAVKNWTGVPTPTGGRLGLLAALWLVGRLAMLAPGMLPAGLAAAVDVAFLPFLALGVGMPIVRAKNYRNLGFLGLLTVLTAANVVFHAAGDDWPLRALYLALHVIVLIIVVVAGRILPNFTAGALGLPVKKDAVTDWIAFGSTALFALLHFAGAPALALGVVAALAAASNLWRMRGWQSWASRGKPILAILHIGYLWVPLGFALQALAQTTQWLTPSAATHALTVGAIGTLTIAMMTRVALGHTGRAIVAEPLIVGAYGFVILAALVRVFGVAAGLDAVLVWQISGGLWAATFAVYVVRYFGILTRPRVDGRPG